MKSIVILYKDKNSLFGHKNVFNNKSSYELSKNWAEKISKDIFYIEDCVNVSDLFVEIDKLCEKESADFVVFSYADLPFLNEELTNKIIEVHTTYKAEYSFADGYPYGFSPEVLDRGTIKILKELSSGNQKDDGLKQVSRDSIFSFIKKDINSYEIESVLADNDWRLLRYNFDCSTKENFLSCQALYNLINHSDTVEQNSVEKIMEKASKCPEILKTVPSYYNIQICDKCSGKCEHCPYPQAYKNKFNKNVWESSKFMEYKKYCELLDEIKSFSNSCVINISAWGEALLHPQIYQIIEKTLSYDDFSLFIETSGNLLSIEFCEKLKEIIDKSPEHKGKWPQIMIGVSIDSFSDETYTKIRGIDGSVKEIAEKIEDLNAVIPGCVYPQFVRMNSNESELELFFRYWNEKTSNSQGNLIIQKYNDFAGLLKTCKPADLSPLERNVCWHLRRDMTILSNGEVPLCSQFVLGGIIGNVFNDTLENIWKKYDSELNNHICGNYSEKCRKCDEYYTFNF